MDYGMRRELVRIIFQRQNIQTLQVCSVFFLSEFCCVMAAWHYISFNQAFMEAWFECLSFRRGTVLALPATSSVLPDCCKKRLCDYSTTDWNAPSVKTSACADALALNKYHQLQMPLPIPLLRGFNNFVCVRGARRGEKLHPQFHLPPLAVREIAQTTLICLIAKTHISFLFHCHVINKWSTNADISRLLKWLQFIVLLEMIFVFAAAVRRKIKDITSPQRQ